MRDYWPSCGWRLLDHDPQGRLVVTDDFLRHLLARPELAPVPESCAAEQAVHAQLVPLSDSDDEAVHAWHASHDDGH